MTQHKKILRYMVSHKEGMTIRDGFGLGINWPHKRISELEQMGVSIKRVDDERDGVRFRRYILSDPQQVAVDLILKSKERK